MRALVVVVVSAAGVVGLSLASGGNGGQAAFPGVNGQIAFYNVAGEERHIFGRTPGTGFRTQLTFGDGFDQNPEYSANGQMIVFDRVLDDVRAIWTMNSDGTNQQLVPGTETGRQAAWAPDGEHVAFTVDGDIYTVHPEGSKLTQLTDDPSELEIEADWSPNGTQIVYRANSQIWVMNADGSNPEMLTSDPDLGAASPDWSPDGQLIAFGGFTDAGGEDILVMNADGTGMTNVTEDAPGAQGSPAFSPDGQKIVYIQATDDLARSGLGAAGAEFTQLFVMNSDGTDRQNLTGWPPGRGQPYVGFVRDHACADGAVRPERDLGRQPL